MANLAPRLTNRRSLLRWRLLLLPYVIGILVLVVLPALFSFGLAFFRYNALSDPVYIGTVNFILAYTDELFSLSVQNSLALILIPVPLRVGGAFLMARLMRANTRLTRWLRPLIYLPTVIPGAAYALAWLWIFNPLFGPLNMLLRAVGLLPPNWLVDPQWVKSGLALMSLWQIGEGFLVSLAALQDLSPEIEEAAQVDGAGPVGVFRHITLPLVAPILLLLLLRDAILTFQQSFTTILLMTGGGPYYASYTLPLFVYEQAFGLLSFGTASAALWVMYAITGLVVVVLYVIARQWDIGTTDETFVI